MNAVNILELRQSQIIEEFEMFSDWMEKYEHIIEIGKELDAIDEKSKVDENLSFCGSISYDITYTLHDANNLISYPYAASQSLGAALPDAIEAEVFANNMKARAICPSGASTGSYEAYEKRDISNKKYKTFNISFLSPLQNQYFLIQLLFYLFVEP